ncbi:Imm1 family immunity protein [Nocardia sp. NPDC059764]|uniref:Imm1 family immunity protein n=1 Tax=Nocardia sp. NPDC059764 TaxID=3346939 RepID=UPI003647014B
MGDILFETAYLPEHRDSPIIPASGEELAAVIDQMKANGRTDCNYLTIFAIDTDRSHIAHIGVGVDVGNDVGSIYFVGAEGAFFSKGRQVSREPLVYFEFGNPRFFAPDSGIGLSDLKIALTRLYQGGGVKPGNVEWQDWFDAEPE